MLAPLLPRAEASAIEAFGATKFKDELEAGQHLRCDAALALALAEPTRSSAASADTRRDVLGRREAEVADLVAEGMSNKQIGASLFISEHTVDSHVRKIFDKLRVNSRAQIAGWVRSSNHD